MRELTHYATAAAVFLALCPAAAPQQPAFKRLAHLPPHAYGGLIQGLDGNLYSTTSGAHSSGEVFRVSPEGALTAVHKLAGQSEAGLVLATDGNSFGTTILGGAPTHAGSVFRITQHGKLTTLHSFCQQDCSDGETPSAPLIQGTDGNLYGTTLGGGLYGGGTIFRITLAGQLTTLYAFCSQSGCADGGGPLAPLFEASDGNFYGTTNGGGVTGGFGVIYRLTPAREYTVLYKFCSQPRCADGGGPMAGLMQASDGNLYGTTAAPNAAYRMSLDGSYQVVYTFCSVKPDCKDGASPIAPLIEATDGNLYGTTEGGGGYDKRRTAFRLTLDGQLTTLHAFCSWSNCRDGESPYGPLFQATDGNLYGTNYGVPTGGGGTVYELVTGFAPFVSSNPAYGNVGKRATILGMNLTGATRVSFNGTLAASFRVNKTGGAIMATVPVGATTGTIQVTLANGTVLSSNVPFQVN